MGDISQMLPLLLLFVVMYFFLIRPGLQKQKKEKKYLEALKTGDKVVTKSGLHGKLLSLNDDGSCVIETSAGKIKFETSSISMEISERVNTPVAKK
jgi:preprotein translocase subunit YajC|tara:strand:+ start:1138 stop:1425 length:288 start_codon:yes stop_codon:yes gene_type:complete